MEEIKVGDFIRNKEGYIGKIEKIIYDDLEKQNYYSCEKHNVMASGYIEQIVAHSPNLIDLIQCGDYVNGYKVISIDRNVQDIHTDCIELDLNNNYEYNFITIHQIKSIVTKEMYKSVEYIVGDESNVKNKRTE